MSSFVGFLPSRKPVVTILVVIDSPKNGAYYGGAVAAPVFKRIAEATLRHLAVPRSLDPDPPVMVQRHTAEPAVATRVSTGRFDIVQAGLVPEDSMPDVRGLSARDALKALVRLGMRPRITGRGVVVRQEPAPGTSLEESASSSLWLDRTPLAPSAEVEAQP
jgi:cell division protein FtsI (penicillin-binding protein 3)